MSVEIDPTELGFQRPFDHEVTQILKIHNPNQNPVAFKVKTTAPKQYCVRPNSGRIEPGKEVEVTVILQPFKQEPAPDAKCRDKFLVQSLNVTADKEFTGVNEIWQHVDNADRSSVHEKKIRVVYLSPGGPLAVPASTPVRSNDTRVSDGQASTPDAPPPYNNSARSPTPEVFTPDTRTSYSGPVSKLKDEPEASKSLGDAKASTFNPATTSVATKIQNAAPMSYDELKVKYDEAQAAIASYANEGGLKMRKLAAGETGNKTVDDVAHRVQAAQG
ncbi:putative vesicle-associated membrane protein-associated protein C16G5.05c, partial [Calycina marina]